MMWPTLPRLEEGKSYTVQVTNASIGSTAAQQMNFYHSDVQVTATTSDNLLPSSQLLAFLQSLPNVVRVEAIDQESVTIAARQVIVIGLPADTRVYHPRLLTGHWLNAQEPDTFVINDFAAQRLSLHVGENVTLETGTKQVILRLVGIVHETTDVAGSSDPNGQVGDAFTTLSTLNLSLRNLPVDATSRWFIQVHDHSRAALQHTVNQIQQIENDLTVEAPALASQQGASILLVIYSLFDTVAILVALVGLLGLTHTLSASVLERRLEIGILRSLGATGWRVGSVFWIEGLVLTLLTWAAGSILGIPGGIGLVQVLETFIQPFDVSVNPLLVLVTLVFAVIVACIASFGPALSASHVRISETLRYE